MIPNNVGRLCALGLHALKLRRLCFDCCMAHNIVHENPDLHFDKFFESPPTNNRIRWDTFPSLLTASADWTYSKTFLNRIISAWTSYPIRSQKRNHCITLGKSHPYMHSPWISYFEKGGGGERLWPTYPPLIPCCYCSFCTFSLSLLFPVYELPHKLLISALRHVCRSICFCINWVVYLCRVYWLVCHVSHGLLLIDWWRMFYTDLRSLRGLKAPRNTKNLRTF